MFFSVIVIGSGLALVRSAAIAIAIVLGTYLYMSFGLRVLLEPARTSNLMVLSQTVLFALAAAYVAEVRARREFLLGHLLDQERKKTEGLLSNVLPDEIAARLKDNPGVLAERHEDASILFADLVGFTPYASSRDAKEVVGFLDDIFSRFDDLVEKHGLEKIKTIGDAYMVAGGVLQGRSGHLDSMADLALAMQAVAKQSGTQMRIGIHCGPLVAGVIGRKKYLYDLWGETVNTASRMESHSLPGRIQVSITVATRLRTAFDLEDRGFIDVKGVGPMQTSFLLGRRRPQAQSDLGLELIAAPTSLE
jgi:guanylate cyclase